ncbi:MAG: hypothetical protein O7E52_04160 [Candidatus Poribacteria bacterium]|nr:hypothetical protein [Candidatus Poribacteria bacterium]
MIFILCCFVIVALLYGLFYTLVRFGRGESYDLRSTHCPTCQTQRKPRKTGVVRNLVEEELQCPECGYISWDIPPKTDLSTPPTDKKERQL